MPPTTKPMPFLERLEVEMRNAFFSNEATVDIDSPQNVKGVLKDLRALFDLKEVPGFTHHMDYALSAMSSLREQTYAANLPDLAQHRPFQYRPLKDHSSIRLVRFGIAEDNDKTITLLFEDVDLDATPTFNVLSYVWGDYRAPLGQRHHQKRSERRFPILLDGARIEVTHNLYCFLRRIFFATDGPLKRVRNTPIWIDQLCINQANIAEKNAQVALMDCVYSQAEEVISWLGEKDGQTDAAIQLVKKLGAWPASDSEPGSAAARLVRAIPGDDWQSLAGLLSRSYFERAWIVQEVALARKLLVLCGDGIIDWKDLVATSKLLEESRAWAILSQHVKVFQPDEDKVNPSNARISTRFGGHLAALLEAQRTIRGDDPSAQKLLFLGRQFQASVVADKFFAMLGIARRSTIIHQGRRQDLPHVDYARSLKEIAMEFARYHMTKSRNVSLLALVEDPAHRTKHAEGFPSWLPDPSAPLLPLPLEADVLGVYQDSLFHCWGAPHYGADVTFEGERLVLQGRRIDSVGPVAEPFNNIAKEDDSWSHIFEFVSHFSSRSGPHLSGLKLGEALWRTLVATPNSPLGSSPTTVSLGHEFGDWCISLLDALRNPDRHLHDDLNEYILAKMYSLDDLVFDIQAFGKDAEDTINSQPLAHEEIPEFFGTVLETQKKRHDDHRKTKLRELEKQLSHRLHQLWHLDPYDVFPSPERITGTLRMMETKAPQADAIKGVIQDGIDRFETSLGMKTDSRRLFTTTSQRLGMGPQSLAPGDEVWLVHGANVPLVLRRVERRETFRLIGEAFVLGIMHGEALQGPERCYATDVEVRLE